MSNIVDLKKFKRAKAKAAKADKKVDPVTSQVSGEAVETDFEAIAEKNAKTAERLKKERLNANKSVLRSYRIKD